MSDAVVSAAGALARAVDGRVMLLTVVQSPALTAESMAVIGNIKEITEGGERFATGQLERYKNQLATEGTPVEALLLYGGPIEHIVDQAADGAVDYIVMGSRGHTALYDVLIGSSTRGVLQRVQCPVVIVPATMQTRAASAAVEELAAV